MILNFFDKGAWPGQVNPVNFWALNSNCSNTTPIRQPNCRTTGFVRRRTIERPRTGVGLLEMGHRVSLPPARRSGEQQRKLSDTLSFPGVGSGAEPRKIRILEHFGTSKITSERLVMQTVRYVLFLIQRRL